MRLKAPTTERPRSCHTVLRVTLTHGKLKPPMIIATAGYLFTYYNSKLSKEREAQIDRVNAQVGCGLQECRRN